MTVKGGFTPASIIRPRPIAIPAEQAVYGSFSFRDQGYAMLSASPGCRPDWLVDFRMACQNLGERPAGAAEAPGLFALRLSSGPWAIVGVFPQGRDDRGRPGALAFHGLFLSPGAYRRLDANPFALADRLRGDWDAETALTSLKVEPSIEPTPGNSAGDDPRASRIAAGLMKGRRVAIESPGPIDGLARQVWKTLPFRARKRLSVATWAFGNGNRFDFLAVPRLVGMSFDRSYIDPLSFEGTLEDLETSNPVGPSLWCSPPALIVLGLSAALALASVGMALRGRDDAEVPSPGDSTEASALSSSSPMPTPSTPVTADDPDERRHAAQALANLADRFEIDGLGDSGEDPGALMERLSRLLRYRGPLLSEPERAALSRDPGHDAALALQWDSHVRVFSTDRPLPPGFRNGPIRWQIDTLAWSFHAEKKAGDTGGTSPRRSAAEVAQALGEALAVDMPLRPNPLTERFPALADYLAFLNRLPRR